MKTKDNRHNGMVQRACNPQPIYYPPPARMHSIRIHIFLLPAYCLLGSSWESIVPEYLHKHVCRLLLGVTVSLKIYLLVAICNGFLGPCNQRSIYRKKKTKTRDQEEAKTNLTSLLIASQGTGNAGNIRVKSSD